jgi:hypothetical protein
MTDGNGCMVTDSATVGSQVGLEDLSGIEFSMYPNPTDGTFQINLSQEDINDSVYLVIVNSLGQRVVTEKVTSNIVDVNIADSDAGTYFVKIISDQGTSVKQIILK